MKIALFDYGAGNLHSLKKALELGPSRAPAPEVIVTAEWKTALAADALVLPGVGSFGAAVHALAGEEERVRDALEGGLPCLGICLGMQLLFPASEEGEGHGIGLIAGNVRRLRTRTVPQMGWNDVELTPGTLPDALPDPLFDTLRDPVAYYANSFVCDVEDPAHVIAWSEYEGERFAAGVRKGASRGVQFHPEKSSADGLRMIRNFLDSVAREMEGGR